MSSVVRIWLYIAPFLDEFHDWFGQSKTILTRNLVGRQSEAITLDCLISPGIAPLVHSDANN